MTHHLSASFFLAWGRRRTASNEPTTIIPEIATSPELVTIPEDVHKETGSKFRKFRYLRRYSTPEEALAERELRLRLNADLPKYLVVELNEKKQV